MEKKDMPLSSSPIYIDVFFPPQIKRMKKKNAADETVSSRARLVLHIVFFYICTDWIHDTREAINARQIFF